MIACAVGMAAACRICLETEQAKVKRAERNRKKELRTLANRISSYGRSVHQRYPTGDVVVSERDLAEQLRKRPDAIATALHILLANEESQRVLETKRLISVGVVLGSSTRFVSSSGALRRTPPRPTSVFSRRLQ